MSDHNHAKAIELIELDQQEIVSREEQLDQLRRVALTRFRQIKEYVTDEELENLAARCDEEQGDNHCVYCAAWAELCDRRGES